MIWLEETGELSLHPAVDDVAVTPGWPAVSALTEGVEAPNMALDHLQVVQFSAGPSLLSYWS